MLFRRPRYVFAPTPAATSVVEIDLSASPTQADFDIDVTDCDILEVYFLAALQSAAATSPALLFSTDGSTYINGASTYANGVNTATTISDTDLPFVGNGLSGGVHYGGFTLFGFLAGHRTGAVGGTIYDGASNTVEIFSGELNATTEVMKIRLGLVADWGATGKIILRKSNVVSQTISTRDWTVDTSGTDGLTFSGKHKAYLTTRDNRNGRLEYRVGTAGGIQGGNIYADGIFASSGVASYRNFLNTSLDNTTGKNAIATAISGLSGGQQGWISHTDGGYGLTYGLSFPAAEVTGIFPHEWDDATGYSAGTAQVLAIEMTSQSEELVTTASSQTTIEFNVAGFNEAAITTPETFGTSLADTILVQISTNNKSSWITTDYIWYQYLGTLQDAQIGAYGLPAVTINTSGVIMLRGIAAGEPFHTFSVGGGTSGIRGGVGMHKTNLDAITDVRLICLGGESFTDAATIRCMRSTY